MKKLFILSLCLCLVITSCQCRREEKTGDPTLPNKLTVWNLYDDSEIFLGQIQAFSSQNPGVEIVYKKFSNIEDYQQLLINEIAEGSGPDIFAISNSWIEKHYKKLQPLPVGQTQVAMDEQVYKNTFLPVVSSDLIRNGKIYGVSLFVDTLALYYNKQILGDHFTSGKPAEIWTKLRQQVEQMTKQDNSIEGFSLSGIAMGKAKNIVRAVDTLYLLMLQYGTEFYDPVSKRIIFAKSQGRSSSTGKSNEPAKNALDFYSSFGRGSYKNYSWSDNMTARYDQDSESHPFVTGKTAMIFGYSYLYEDLISLISQTRNKNTNTIDKNDIKIAPAPQISSFSESSRRDSLASYFPLVVSRNSANPYLAWDFLLYLSGKQSAADYHERTHKPSARIDLLDDQKLDPTYGVFARQASYSKSYPDLVLDNEKYNLVFKDIIEQTSSNKSSSSKALLAGQKKIQCMLDKILNRDSTLHIDCMEE